MSEYQVFISYRRDTGSQMAVLIHTQLNKVHGIKTFLDVVDLGASYFDDQLKRLIRETPNFVLLLTEGSLDRCENSDDWVRQEIALALESGKRIVPVMIEGFKFPPSEKLPEDIRDITRINSVQYVHTYFGPSIDRLVNFLDIKSEDTDQEAPLPKAVRSSDILSKKEETAPDNDQPDEESYRKEVREVLEDGIITKTEEKVLKIRQNEFKISDDAATRVLEEEKRLCGFQDESHKEQNGISESEQPIDETSQEDDQDKTGYVLSLLSKDQLKGICGKNQLPVSGLKNTLIERIVANFDNNLENILSQLTNDDLWELCGYLELPVSGSKSEKISRILGYVNQTMQEDDEEQDDEEPIGLPDILNSLSKDQLKCICESNRLLVSGSKATLLERIITYFDNDLSNILNNLTNNDLKNICSYFELAVSGNKDVLINRILEISGNTEASN